MQGLREAFGRISFVGDREQITSRVQEILEIRVRRRGVEIAGLDPGRGRTAVTSKGGFVFRGCDWPESSSG